MKPTVLLIFFVLLGVLSTFFGDYSHVLEIGSHFRPIWFLICCICATLCFSMKSYKMAAFSAAIAFLNLLPIGALYVKPEIIDHPHKFSILAMNIWGGRNHDTERTIALINDTDSDFLAISEVTPSWVDVLKLRCEKNYPFQIFEERFGGIAFLSKYPIKRSTVEYFGQVRRPRIKADVQMPDTLATFVIAHPCIPRFTGSDTRNGELEAIALESRQAGQKGLIIVAGDLNCTSFSPKFSELLMNGALHDSESGFGLQPSWSAFWFLPIVSIDHCLVGSNISVIQRKLTRKVGSDHYPLYVQMSY